MATTEFTNLSTVIDASWLNEADAHVYDQNTVAHSASHITNTPAGNIAATTVQAAVNELDSEKAGVALANTFTQNQVISVTDNTNAALRITQLGTGNALVVEDSANPDSTPFVIDASGNVGVGISSPAQKLHVSGAAGTNSYTYITNGAQTVLFGVSSASTTLIGTLSNDPMLFYANNTERMRLDASGNLGLGVTPSAWTVPTLEFNAAYAIGQVGFSQNAYYGGSWKYKTSAAASLYQHSGGAHTWYVTPAGTANGAITWSTVMTLDASGNLGLGVTPSALNTSYKSIQVNNSGLMVHNTNGNSYLNQSAYFDSGGWKYAVSTGASSYQMTAGAHAWYSAPSGTAGTAITFTQVLAVDKDKSLALQGATSQAGAGISFPATQVASADANTLDDYEEGTWTPTQGAGLTVVGTFSSSGTYTKVGRMVVVNGLIGGSTSVAVAAGAIMVGALPFLTAQAASGVAVNNATAGAFAATNSIVGSANLYSAGAIAATTSVSFTLTYFV